MATATLKISRDVSDDVFRSATILYRLDAARTSVVSQTFVAFNGEESVEIQEQEGFAYRLVVTVFGPRGAKVEITVAKGASTLVDKLKAEIMTDAGVTRRAKTFLL